MSASFQAFRRSKKVANLCLRDTNESRLHCLRMEEIETDGNERQQSLWGFDDCVNLMIIRMRAVKGFERVFHHHHGDEWIR